MSAIRLIPPSERRPLPCPEPGVYEGVPADTYHQWSAMHSTALSSWLVSAKQGAHDWTKGGRAASAAMRLGTIVHALALEPDEFSARYIVSDGPINPRTNAPYGRDTKAFETWLSEQDGEVIATDEHAQAVRMAEAIREHDAARALAVAGAQRELSVVWDDHDLGFRCKARVDFYHPGGGLIADLKTAASVEPRVFERRAWDLGYCHQAAWYLRGVSQAGLSVDRGFASVVVQSEEPHDIIVTEWVGAAVDLAWAEVEIAADRVRDWLDGKPLGGVSAEPVSLTAPVWAQSSLTPRTPLLRRPA